MTRQIAVLAGCAALALAAPALALPSLRPAQTIDAHEQPTTSYQPTTVRPASAPRPAAPRPPQARVTRAHAAQAPSAMSARRSASDRVAEAPQAPGPQAGEAQSALVTYPVTATERPTGGPAPWVPIPAPAAPPITPTMLAAAARLPSAHSAPPPQPPAPAPAARTPPPLTNAAGVAGAMSLSAARQIAVTLGQMHMGACSPAVQRAADFLIEGQPARFTAQPMGPDANRYPVVFTIESGDPSSPRTRLSTLMITPDCSGMYQQVIYWPVPCDRLQNTVFSTFHSGQVMLRDVRVSELTPGLQLYLTPAGPGGCISVKKELFR